MDILSIIPVDFKPMSIITLIILTLIFYIILLKINNLKEKGKLKLNEFNEKHETLRKDYEKARDIIHEKIENSFKTVFEEIRSMNSNLSKLSERTAEQGANNSNIAKNIDNIQKDFRDFKTRVK